MAVIGVTITIIIVQHTYEKYSLNSVLTFECWDSDVVMNEAMCVQTIISLLTTFIPNNK